MSTRQEIYRRVKRRKQIQKAVADHRDRLPPEVKQAKNRLHAFLSRHHLTRKESLAKATWPLLLPSRLPPQPISLEDAVRKLHDIQREYVVMGDPCVSRSRVLKLYFGLGSDHSKRARHIRIHSLDLLMNIGDFAFAPIIEAHWVKESQPILLAQSLAAEANVLRICGDPKRGTQKLIGADHIITDLRYTKDSTLLQEVHHATLLQKVSCLRQMNQEPAVGDLNRINQLTTQIGTPRAHYEALLEEALREMSSPTGDPDVAYGYFNEAQQYSSQLTLQSPANEEHSLRTEAEALIWLDRFSEAEQKIRAFNNLWRKHPYQCNFGSLRTAIESAGLQIADLNLEWKAERLHCVIPTRLYELKLNGRII